MSGSFDKYIQKNFRSDTTVSAELDQYSAYIGLATRIYELRRESGLSQRDLAKILDTSQANVARWETPGYTSYTITSLEKLSKVFGAILRIQLDTNEPVYAVNDREYGGVEYQIHITTPGSDARSHATTIYTTERDHA